MSRLHKSVDEVFVNTLHETGHDEVTGVLTQPTQKLILERNKELRNNPGALRDLTFGRHVACIPMLDYLDLQRKYPELNSDDPRHRTKVLLKLLTLPDNEAFLVRPKKQGRI